MLHRLVVSDCNGAVIEKWILLLPIMVNYIDPSFIVDVVKLSIPSVFKALERVFGLISHHFCQIDFQQKFFEILDPASSSLHLIKFLNHISRPPRANRELDLSCWGGNVAIPNGVFGNTLENMREHIEPLMFNEYVWVVCKVLDYSGIPLWEHRIGDIAEFPTIKAIVKMNPYPDSWEAAFVLQFLVNLPCPDDSRFEFMVEGVVKFAVLVNAPIPRPQET